MFVLTGIICSLRWYIYLHLCLMRLVSVCYCVYRILMICGVCYVWRKRLYVKGIRPRTLTYGKGGELKQINPRVKGVRPRPLTWGKGGELK